MGRLAAGRVADLGGSAHDLGKQVAVFGELVEVILKQRDDSGLERRDQLPLLPEDEAVDEQVHRHHLGRLSQDAALVLVKGGPRGLLAFLERTGEEEEEEETQPSVAVSIRAHQLSLSHL